MKPDYSFENQLKSLEHEANVIANYTYAEMTIQHAASQSKKLLDHLNETPTFWISCTAALQSAAYIALGRVFDQKSPYNLEALMISMERDLTIFGRDALAHRKRNGATSDPAWLDAYLSAAHYPTKADVARLRRNIEKYRCVYERAIMPVRHQYLAHRQAHGNTKVQALFARGKVADLWRLSTFLVRLHSALWGLLHNGRKPLLTPVRFSVNRIYADSSRNSRPNEQIVRETRALMKALEQLPKSSFRS